MKKDIFASKRRLNHIRQAYPHYAQKYDYVKNPRKLKELIDRELQIEADGWPSDHHFKEKALKKSPSVDEYTIEI